MPTIAQLSEPVDVFPNLYISPYGNDGVIPLYSSVPINNFTSGDCLPCVVCGNSKTRAQILADQLKSNQYKPESQTELVKY
jgi:hypothetical protein